MTTHEAIRRIPGKGWKIVKQSYMRSKIRDWLLSWAARSSTNSFLASGNRYVIFLVEGWDIVNGGILSIASISSESRKLLSAKGVGVAVCTAHDEPRILRYTKFDNDIILLSFDELLARYPHSAEVMVHIPEFLTKKFGVDCADVYRSRPDIRWRFNILLQNIDLVPSRQEVARLAEIGRVTATTAHKAYATAETAAQIGCPIHHLSTFVSPEGYERGAYPSKHKTIVVSPDIHPARPAILSAMSAALPDHKIIEIRNMTYRTYRETIKNAKFSFTFGEGLDAYLVEPIFSGAIGMAIFNDRFFTDEYRRMDGVFPDIDSAIRDVSEFVKNADDEAKFSAIAARQHALVAKNYARAEYLQNIETFYEKYFLRPTALNTASDSDQHAERLAHQGAD